MTGGRLLVVAGELGGSHALGPGIKMAAAAP